MTSKDRLCVIMPAYNEAKSIRHVLLRVAQHVDREDIVVVNDGSTDDTSQVARTCGVTVLDLPYNLGIGGAVQTGLKYAVLHTYDIAMQVDADGQHDPDFIPKLRGVLSQDPAIDMVIGSRFKASTRYRSSIMRLLGIRIFSWLIGIVTNKVIYDSTSGFRVYGSRALRYLADHYPSDFPEPESIVMVLNRGMKIKEVPVEMNHRATGDSIVSHDVSFKAAYFVLSNSIAILISSLKARTP